MDEENNPIWINPENLQIHIHTYVYIHNMCMCLRRYIHVCVYVLKSFN